MSPKAKSKFPLNGRSAKQALLEAKVAGDLTAIQLRLGSSRLDELLADGKDPQKAVDTVMAEAAAGELKGAPESDPELKHNLAKLSDAPADDSPKQKLLWLRQKDALTPNETRSLAQRMDKGQPIIEAIVAEGLTRLLTEDEMAEAAPVEDGSGEPLTEDEFDDWVERIGATDVGAIEAILMDHVPEVSNRLDGVEDPAHLLALAAAEKATKDRNGVMKVLKKKIEAHPEIPAGLAADVLSGKIVWE